jgi:hypothetical protein
MYDPAPVRGMDRPRDALEERYELLERHRPILLGSSRDRVGEFR